MTKMCEVRILDFCHLQIMNVRCVWPHSHVFYIIITTIHILYLTAV